MAATLAITGAEAKRKRDIARALREQSVLLSALKEIRHNRDLFHPVSLVERRKDALLAGTVVEGERGRDYAPLLAGIGAHPPAREIFETAIDGAVIQQSYQIETYLDFTEAPYVNEIVIGSGVHAAIYASVTNRKPLVIEQRNRIGGVFGLATRPVFKLNSRNRPERRDVARRPGTVGALNSEIGGAVQLSDITSDEYPTQDLLGFVTRVNLALYARNLVNAKVTSIEPNTVGEGRYRVKIRVRGRLDLYVRTDRIIIATGTGRPSYGEASIGEISTRPNRVFNFEEFVEFVGNKRNPFPLQGWKNVAVVGANDSGNVVVEYLLGQGGDHGLSSALDRPESITWIGQQSVFKDDFEANARSRYAGIGRSFTRAGCDYPATIKPINGRLTSARVTFNGEVLTQVRATGPRFTYSFDHVVLATGYVDVSDELVGEFAHKGDRQVELAGLAIAKQYVGEEIYKVGPAANLKVTDQERSETPALKNIPDNSVAVFRYAERTASLAGLLPAPSGPDRLII